jgi:hypothetical protein
VERPDGVCKAKYSPAWTQVAGLRHRLASSMSVFFEEGDIACRPFESLEDILQSQMDQKAAVMPSIWSACVPWLLEFSSGCENATREGGMRRAIQPDSMYQSGRE